MKCKSLFTTVIILFSLQAQATVCRDELQTETARLEVCSDLTTEEVTIAIQRPGQPLVVKAQFANDNFWSKLWVDAGDAVIQHEDQRLLREAVSKATLSMRTQRVAEFLTEFVEPGTRLEPFDINTSPLRFQAQALAQRTQTVICQYIGKIKDAIFSAHANWFKQRVRVGDLRSQCFGRCGAGCGDATAARRYTQECLNHDACNRVIGTQLGECSDEFWAASYGFFNAENCW